MRPLLFLPSGLYVVHEGAGVFTIGKSFPTDYVGYDDFTWERKTFEELVWPELVEYIPEFDRLKIQRGWAGLYEVNTLDGNAILGQWPDERLFHGGRIFRSRLSEVVSRGGTVYCGVDITEVADFRFIHFLAEAHFGE